MSICKYKHVCLFTGLRACVCAGVSACVLACDMN